MCELLAMCFARPLYADISIRAFAVRDEENADGWGLAWYPDRSLAIAKEPITWRESPYAEFLQTYAHLHSHIYVGHVRKKTMGGENTRADSHPFARELDGVEYCFAHNGTIRTAWTDLPSTRFAPIGDTDSEQVFCHLMDQLAERSDVEGSRSRGVAGARRSASRLKGILPRDLPARPPALAPLASPRNHAWLHQKAAAINELGKFNMLLTDGVRLLCYHDVNGFKGLWLCNVPANHHREMHHLDDSAVHVDFEMEPATAGVIVATVPLNDEPGWRRFEPGEMIVVEEGRITYAATLGVPSRQS